MNLFSILRIKDWIKNLGVVLIGSLLGGVVWVNLLFAVLSALFALIFAFSFNEYFDKKLYLTSRKNCLFLISPVIFFSILFAASLKLENLILITLFIILVILYSADPPRLKKWWPFSLSFNAFLLGPLLFFHGFYATSSLLTSHAITFSIIFLIYMLFSELIHQVAHLGEDKKENIHSLPAVIGAPKTLKFAKLICFIPLVASLIMLYLNFFSNLVFLGTIVFTLSRIKKISDLDIEKTDFERFRSEVYGFEEGGLYILFLL